MGNIISAIYDDIQEYCNLCEAYGEKVRTKSDAYGNMYPDCYGDHSHDLQKRHQQEREAIHKKPS